MLNATAIIPVRYNSTRFPGKPLASIKGKTMIQHVYENVSKAKLLNNVLVATDDERIRNEVISFGGKVVMTSDTHESGSDRIAEAAADIECDCVVNVQGDEPFIRPEMIDDVVEVLYNDDRADISTLAKRITDRNEIISPNVVKVVVDSEWFALYFSRAPVPFFRNEWNGLNDIALTDDEILMFKHIGIYGFRKNGLLRFSSLPRTRLETVEKLEQLRALETGMKIKVSETEFDTFGIDTIEDLRKAEEIFN